MRLRRATRQDLPYVLQLEARFCSLGFVGRDEEVMHHQQIADADCFYGIVECDEKAAGYVILRDLRSINQSIELKRIVIAEPDKGLGTRVLENIITKSFEELSAHRLWLDVYADNERALHVYRSLGFVDEGVLRECICTDGRYRSLVVMSMLRSEYEARVNQSA